MLPLSPGRSLRKRTLQLPVTLFFALATTGCWDRADPELDVRLESGPTTEVDYRSQPDSAADPIRFVYASVLSPELSTVTYAVLGNYLSRKLERPVEIVRRRTYAELNELLRTGAADAGLICSGAFAAGEDDFGLEAVAIPVIGGRLTYQSYLIARKGSGLRGFDELRGVRFAFSDPLSNTGYRYVAARLLAMGLSPEDYFSRTLFTYSHDNSIEAVRDGIVDAGSVDSLVWDELVRRDPGLEEDLTIIGRSEEFPINPVAVAPAIAPELRTKLVAVFLSMAEDPDGRRVLSELGTDAFVAPSEEALAGYRAIARSWRDLSAGSGRDPEELD